MKIILIVDEAGKIRNYADSTLQRNGQAWFVPEIGGQWTATVCPAVKISRLGTHIAEKFASRYYETVGAAALFFPEGVAERADMASEEFFVRDSALCLGEAVAVGSGGIMHSITVGDQTMEFDTATLKVDQMISDISRYATLKMGDVLIFGSRVLKVALTEGGRLDVAVDGRELVSLKIK